MAETTEEEQPMENWKQFRGTELGNLMASIYATKPKINYPKPKTKPRSVETTPHGSFIVTKVDASDPRKSTRKQVEVDMPHFGRRHSDSSKLHPVDFVPKRRSGEVIQAEIEEIKMRQNHYRPAYTQAISSDVEKQRFSEICTYKGGKGLPIVLPVGEAPFEIAAKARQARLEDEHRAKRNGGVVRTKHTPAAISVDEQLAIQITAEIDDRREYLEELRASGELSAEKESRLRGEIASRLNELKRLNV